MLAIGLHLRQLSGLQIVCCCLVCLSNSKKKKGTVCRVTALGDAGWDNTFSETAMTFSNLHTAGTLSWVGCKFLRTVSFPALTAVNSLEGKGIEAQGNLELQSMSFPLLNTITSALEALRLRDNAMLTEIVVHKLNSVTTNAITSPTVVSAISIGSNVFGSLSFPKLGSITSSV